MAPAIDGVASLEDYEMLAMSSGPSIVGAIDFSRAAICVISIGLVVLGSYRSIKLDSERSSNSLSSGLFGGPQFTVLSSWQALLLPVVASVALLVMFLFFDSLQLAFAVAAAVLATVAFAFLLLPLCQAIVPGVRAEVLSGALSLLLVGCWLATGHWFFMDLLGMALSVAFIALVRLPSLKVSSMLLIGLLVYDIFWVFFSASLFSTNVMVRVATRPAENPLAALASRLNLPRPPRLSLPGKLVFPSSFSGGSLTGGDPTDQFLQTESLRLFKQATEAALEDELTQALSRSTDSAAFGSVTTRVAKHLINPERTAARQQAAQLILEHQRRQSMLAAAQAQHMNGGGAGGGGFAILGLGDIVMPGLLLCFVLRYDALKKAQNSDKLGTGSTFRQDVREDRRQVCPSCNSIIIVPAVGRKKVPSTTSFGMKKKASSLSTPLLSSSDNNEDDDTFDSKIQRDTNLLYSPASSTSSLIGAETTSNDCTCTCPKHNFRPEQRMYHDAFGLHTRSSTQTSILSRMTYFHCSLIGYVLGLLTATVCSEMFQNAQPALLYLVPFTLLPLVVMAYVRGDLALMWNEPFNGHRGNYYRRDHVI